MRSWKDARLRASETRKIAEQFRSFGFMKTAQLVNEIAEDIQRGDSRKTANDFDKLFDIYRHEYCAHDRDKEKLFDFLSDSLIGAVGKYGSSFRDKVLETVPIFQSMVEAGEAFADVFEIFRKSLVTAQRDKYYTMCLLYLLDVEGQFDEAVRIVSFLRFAVSTRGVQVSDVWESKLWDLRKQLKNITSGESETLFSGWEDGHLRNAIAHCRFEYDKSSRKMVFWDFDPRTRKENYRKPLSYSSFYALFDKIGDVVVVLAHLFLIVRIHDYAFSSQPFG